MSQRTGTLLVAAAVFATCVLGCGVRDTPSPSGGEGAAAGETMGAGRGTSEGGTAGLGGASAGGSGEGGFRSCELDPWWGASLFIAACFSPRTTPSEGSLDRLTVLEKVPGDPAACDQHGILPYGHAYDEATGPWAAWRLAGEDGQSFVVQFALGSVPDDLLMPGDLVNVRYGFALDVEGRGYLSVERFESEEAPVIFLVNGGIVPSVNVERGPALCRIGSCPLTMTRIAVNGEVRDLGLEERAEVGGMLIQNDWFKQACDVDEMQDSWVVGGYAVQSR